MHTVADRLTSLSCPQNKPERRDRFKGIDRDRGQRNNYILQMMSINFNSNIHLHPEEQKKKS